MGRQGERIARMFVVMITQSQKDFWDTMLNNVNTRIGHYSGEKNLDIETLVSLLLFIIIMILHTV